jgi:tetratricopeptide (TPR) repeat protein
MSVAEDGGVATRGSDLALARLHLRLGSLALARAELETLAGRDALDQDGLVDLAEARWRTGDIAGAGEAAVAALDDEDGPLLALVVAAEAAAARGRPTEARRFADRAMEVANGSIDALFAGMPRAGVWPPDAAAPPPSPTTMFDPPRRASSVVHRHPRPHDEGAAVEAPAPAPEDVDEAPAGPSGDADAATIGLWEVAAATHDPDAAADLTADVEEGGQTAGPDDQPTGETELDLGRAALEAGDADEAAVRLGLVLRVAPALAPAVLDLVEGRTERGMALVRGDAYRLVGREIEARRAFVEAASGGPWPPPAPDHEPDTPRDEPTDLAGSTAEAGTELHADEHWAPAAETPDDVLHDPSTDPPSQGDPA